MYEKIRNKKILKQSKPAVYSHGNLFSFKLKEFLKQNSLTPKPLYSILLDTFEESIDIDTKEDIRIPALLQNTTETCGFYTLPGEMTKRLCDHTHTRLPLTLKVESLYAV